MRQCGAAVRSACDTVTPLRSVSMLQTCCSSFTQHWRSAALSVQKRIQTDEHDTQTETFMHISITHTPTHTHTGTHTQARPAGTHRAHLQVLAHTYRHRHAHALTRANRARPRLLETALPPLLSRVDAYTLRFLCISPAPALVRVAPPPSTTEGLATFSVQGKKTRVSLSLPQTSETRGGRNGARAGVRSGAGCPVLHTLVCGCLPPGTCGLTLPRAQLIERVRHA